MRQNRERGSDRGDMRSSLEHELDRALEERGERRARGEEDRAAVLERLERFLAGGERALRIAVAAIEERAEAFDLATPIEFKAEVHHAGGSNPMASLRIAMRRRGSDTPARPAAPQPQYTWQLTASARRDAHRDIAASFSITAWRGGWQDIWSTNSGAITTPECDPRGLSLDSTGEEITSRFMAWFTRYVAR